MSESPVLIGEISSRAAVTTGLAVFAAGFGGQMAFWLLGSWPSDVPGLTDFRGAIVGDSVLVPVLVTALLDAGSRAQAASNQGEKSEASSIARLGALIGLAGGIGVQAAWLLDDFPRLNWAMVRPHQFTAPGWYHAVFLCGTTCLIGGATGRLISRMRESAHLPNAAVISFAGLSFALIQAVDLLVPAGPGPTDIAPGGIVSAGTTVVATIAALLAVRPRGIDRDMKAYRRSTALGATAAAGLAAACIPWSRLLWIRPPLAAALALGAHRVPWRGSAAPAARRRVNYPTR